MDAKREKEKKEGAGKPDAPKPESVQTPPPPQVLDPSQPPGEGSLETYERDQQEKKKKSTD